MDKKELREKVIRILEETIDEFYEEQTPPWENEWRIDDQKNCILDTISSNFDYTQRHEPNYLSGSITDICDTLDDIMGYGFNHNLATLLAERYEDYLNSDDIYNLADYCDEFKDYLEQRAISELEEYYYDFDSDEYEGANCDFQDCLESRLDHLGINTTVDCGSYKWAVIVPALSTVFKFDKINVYLTGDEDNLENEYEKFQLYKEQGLDCFLVPMIISKDIDCKVLVVEQPIVDVAIPEHNKSLFSRYYSEKRGKNSKKIHTFINNLDGSQFRMGYHTVMDFIRCHGIKKMMALDEAMENGDLPSIGDLHAGNLATYNGKIAILDYGL